MKRFREVTALCAIALVTLTAFGCGDSNDSDSPSGQVAQSGSSGEAGAQGGQGATAKTSSGEGKKKSGSGKGSTKSQNSANDADSSQPKFKSEPTPTQLYTSASSGVRVNQPTVVAIRDQRTLDQWVKREGEGNPQGATAIEVQFDKNRQAWAVFMPRSPKGAKLAVSNVRYDGKTPRIYATLTVPGKGCKTYGSSSTYPTAWVETRKLSGTPQLKVGTFRTTC